MARDPAETRLRREANRRYWETDESVNGIAEAMELSKGRLYDVLESLPVRARCPECGGTLAHEHRTARDRGVLTCQACGFEGGADELEGGTDLEPHPLLGKGRPRPSPGGGGLASPSPGAGDGFVVGALLVGVAAGLLLGRWLR